MQSKCVLYRYRVFVCFLLSYLTLTILTKVSPPLMHMHLATRPASFFWDVLGQAVIDVTFEYFWAIYSGACGACHEVFLHSRSWGLLWDAAQPAAARPFRCQGMPFKIESYLVIPPYLPDHWLSAIFQFWSRWGIVLPPGCEASLMASAFSDKAIRQLPNQARRASGRSRLGFVWTHGVYSEPTGGLQGPTGAYTVHLVKSTGSLCFENGQVFWNSIHPYFIQVPDLVPDLLSLASATCTGETILRPSLAQCHGPLRGPVTRHSNESGSNGFFVYVCVLSTGHVKSQWLDLMIIGTINVMVLRCS